MINWIVQKWFRENMQIRMVSFFLLCFFLSFLTFFSFGCQISWSISYFQYILIIMIKLNELYFFAVFFSFQKIVFFFLSIDDNEKKKSWGRFEDGSFSEIHHYLNWWRWRSDDGRLLLLLSGVQHPAAGWLPSDDVGVICAGALRFHFVPISVVAVDGSWEFEWSGERKRQ